jgi:hypothetical protein
VSSSAARWSSLDSGAGTVLPNAPLIPSGQAAEHLGGERLDPRTVWFISSGVTPNKITPG